jgi:hypothetical protein
MRPKIVVGPHPVVGSGLRLPCCNKGIRVKNVFSKGSVKSLDVGILGRATFLDMPEFNLLFFAPLLQCMGYKFRAIVNSKALWPTTPANELP